MNFFNKPELINRMDNGENFDFVLFFREQKSTEEKLTTGCLSQWYISPFVEDGITFQTAEHYMMYQKAKLFNDKETAKLILDTPANRQFLVKQYGREVRNFNQDKWDNCKYSIVLNGNILKFEQNKNLKNYLKKFKKDKNVVFIEASPYDYIWGIGLHALDKNSKRPKGWEGENLLGFAITEYFYHYC